MAEGMFNFFSRQRGLDARAESAGTLGGGTINPIAAQAMAEIGIPLTGHIPKALTQEMVDRADRIISMGCGVDADACPAKFLVTEDWGLDDPAGQDLHAVRSIRDQIQRRVGKLLDDLKQHEG
jgi:protein-tyrosine-phosphatase